MATENKPRQKSRAHKESGGGGRGARRTRLTDLEKILIANGGMGHRVLRDPRRTTGFSMPKGGGRKKIPNSLRPKKQRGKKVSIPSEDEA